MGGSRPKSGRLRGAVAVNAPSASVGNSDGLTVRHKVVAYIASDDWLLVFWHLDVPGAGIQVPAGTVEPDEDPGLAALREAGEETGLTDLTLIALLGSQARDMRDYGRPEIHLRYFYHLRCGEARRAAWRHDEREPADGGPPVRFELFWVRLPDQVPPLIADQDALLPELLARLRLASPLRAGL